MIITVLSPSNGVDIFFEFDEWKSVADVIHFGEFADLLSLHVIYESSISDPLEINVYTPTKKNLIIGDPTTTLEVEKFQRGLYRK